MPECCIRLREAVLFLLHFHIKVNYQIRSESFMKRGAFIKNTGMASMVVMVCLTGACSPQPGPGSKPEERVAATSSDSAAPSVTIESGKRTVEIIDAVEQWPSEAPSEVPRFPFGTIRKIIRTETPDGNSWDMAIDRLPEHAVRDYELMLRERGFKTSSMIVPEKDGDRGSVTGEKGAITVVVIGAGSSASLSIIQKQQ